MQVKELLAVMRSQTEKENATMHVVVGFVDDEEYFSTWLPDLSDLEGPEYSERSIRSMWFSQECNTLCISVSGGVR